MGKYQNDNDQFIKSRNKYSFNQMKYSDRKPENTKKLKKYFLKLRKRIKYNILSFFNSKK